MGRKDKEPRQEARRNIGPFDRDTYRREREIKDKPPGGPLYPSFSLLLFSYSLLTNERTEGKTPQQLPPGSGFGISGTVNRRTKERKSKSERVGEEEGDDGTERRPFTKGGNGKSRTLHSWRM